MVAARWVRLGWLVPLALVAALALLAGPDSTADEAKPIQIALPNSLFRDTSKGMIDAVLPVFDRLMANQTGMKGKIIILSGGDEIGAQLADNKVQLAVFHGYEFAWAQAKHPNLRPLVVAVKKDPTLSAEIVVAADSKVEKLGDLQGQTVAVPRGTPEHCRLFLARRIRGIGHRQEKFIQSTKPTDVGAALDDVANGKAKATVVDSVAWDNYQWLNPGRARKLRSLLKSESFPTGVVAYKDGGISDADLKKFKDGLTTAHQRAEGLQLMMLLKLTRFDGVPPNYQQSLADIAKAYPPPISGDEP